MANFAITNFGIFITGENVTAVFALVFACVASHLNAFAIFIIAAGHTMVLIGTKWREFRCTGFIVGALQFAAILFALCIAAAICIIFAFIAAYIAIAIADFQLAAIFVFNTFLCASMVVANQIAVTVCILFALIDTALFFRTNLVIVAIAIAHAFGPAVVIGFAYQPVWTVEIRVTPQFYASMCFADQAS